MMYKHTLYKEEPRYKTVIFRNVSLTDEAVNMESNNNVAAKYFQGKYISISLQFHGHI